MGIINSKICKYNKQLIQEEPFCSLLMEQHTWLPETFRLDKTCQYISQKYSFIVTVFHNLKIFLNSGNRILQLPHK